MPGSGSECRGECLTRAWFCILTDACPSLTLWSSIHCIFRTFESVLSCLGAEGCLALGSDDTAAMARQAVWSLAAVLLIAGCLSLADAQKVDVAGSVLAGAKAVSGSDSKQGKRA